MATDERQLAAIGATEIRVRGMTCHNCVRHVTEAVQSVTDVAGVLVDLGKERASVRWRPGATGDVKSVLQAIGQAGYSASVEDSASAPRRSNWSPLAGWRFNVVVGSIATLTLMVGEWIFQFGMTRWFQWLAFAVALPVQIFCGARFYRGAWAQLKIGASNMDTLVALGSTTAFVYSAWALFAGLPGHLYFMEAVAIVSLISVGHWLEALASDRAAGALRALLNLAPPTARKLGPNQSEFVVPVAALQCDATVLLKPGDRVPTDGKIIEGNSAVDESMLTGESLPVDKSAGARLYAGTINLNGRVVMRVEAIGEATALAQIILVVQRAQSSRAGIQRLGDRVSNVFVPVVILIALATGLWWGFAPEQARQVSGWLEPFLWSATRPDGALASAIFHAAAVLIIACPCAMGLATPAAIMAGTNAAARRGILIRDGTALEKAGDIDIIFFDKTGTLTQGKPDVIAVEDFRASEARGDAIETIAATLARGSNHPLSQAIARFADETLPLHDWSEHRGAGVAGTIELCDANLAPVKFQLGSLNWLQAAGIDLSAAENFACEWSARGSTILGIAARGQLAGVFAVRDDVKPHAAEVVAQLQQAGHAIYLITGDHERTAAAIAAKLGIPSGNVHAEIRPEKKAALVEELQRSGHKVAFVGDGINDAPALEQADLGIAVSRASDVAREAADIVLLNSDIQAMPEALGLAQATLRTIKQNLFWAFFYNAAGVPLAALGFISPVLCAAAMGLSDLIVIGNALRLRRWRK
ncbi:MAG: cation-translocating P-type ATPase [Verrucomicrobia bacterium]|nr:cation-translocating P-type ATPase [Verrucomicrobiota bacterium]